MSFGRGITAGQFLVAAVAGILAGCLPYRSWSPAYGDAQLEAKAMSFEVGGVKVRADLEESPILVGSDPLTSGWSAEIELKNELDSAIVYDVRQVALVHSEQTRPTVAVRQKRGWNDVRGKLLYPAGPVAPDAYILELLPGKGRKFVAHFDTALFREEWDEPVFLRLGAFAVGERSVEIPDIAFLPDGGAKTH